MTDFSGMSITTADNGFMVETKYGGTRRVFTSFTEAAEYFREPAPAPAWTDVSLRYAEDRGMHTLREVIALARAGNKITAIKLMREMYDTRLALREAKELVEAMCGE